MLELRELGGNQLPSINTGDIRRVVLEIVGTYAGENSNLQSGTVVRDACRKLGVEGNRDAERAVLTVFHDLFRNGYLAWGFDANNTDPPFCHVTAQGRTVLQQLDRDPANPDGYLAYLSSNCPALDALAKSYLEEGLKAFNADCYRAAAVMLGASSECLIRQLRDNMTSRLDASSRSHPAGLDDWKMKRVFDAITAELDARRSNFPSLRERYDSFWQAFVGQLRLNRNDAGHPSPLGHVTWETVDSSFLIFPELVKLIYDIGSWVSSNYP